MTRNILLAGVFLAISVLSSAGQGRAYLDSLLAVNQRYEQIDTGKVKLLLNISFACAGIQPGIGSTYADQALRLIHEQFPDPFLRAMGYNAKAGNQRNMGNFQVALDLQKQSLAIFDSLGKKEESFKILNSIGNTLYGMNRSAEAKTAYEKVLVYARESGNKKLQASAESNLGLVFDRLEENERAIEHFDKGIRLYEELGDQAGVARNLDNKGGLYIKTGAYAKALDCLLRALAINEPLKNQRATAQTYSNIGLVYESLSDREKAISYLSRALEIYRKTGDQFSTASVLSNLGLAYKGMNQAEKALQCLKESIDIAERLKIGGGGTYPYTVISALYQEQGNFPKAMDYVKRGLQAAKAANNPGVTAFLLSQKGAILRQAPDSFLIREGYRPESRFDTALAIQLRTLQLGEDLRNPELTRMAYSELSAVYEHLGDYKKSHEAYRNYIAYRDSIAGEDTKKLITRREIQYEFDKKEASLKFEQQLTLGQLEKQKLLSIQQQQALTISNKEKDLQRLAFLKEKAEKQEKEQLLALAEKDKALQASDLATLTKEKALQLKTLAQKNALIGFLLAGIAAILLCFAALHLLMRQRQIKRNAAAQAQYTRQLLENIEEERGRIALDLHDSISHELLGLKQNIRNGSTPTPDTGDKIDGIINDIRQISRNLHPVMLDKIGLRLSLETLCEQFMQQESLFISHEINYPTPLPKTAELQLFRIVQEGLTNAHKYAHAEAVNVKLEPMKNGLQLVIHDNGKGFDVQDALHSSKAFGLHSILQRSKAIGGYAEIRSGQGGTMIRVEVPVA
ncbi:MAG: sensor histidine kinase [Saprospiraceae bacterium]|jgi:signal transduction histidine kinase/tetratricopeptide (TPR) repeat protein|nr:sensor histidine kinase [Saprospiraceae bacterium]